MKEDKEMCKDISTRQDQNFILMKEEVEQPPWTVMESEEEKDVMSKSMIEERDSVEIEDARMPYESEIHPVAQNVA